MLELPQDLTRVGTRLLAALLAGALIGAQRQWSGKAAGLRTHMLVALGTATLVVGCAEFGMGADPLSRVIQGLITGIGFLGAGTILKRAEQKQVNGLTTAAGIWMTAAASIAIGLGRYAVGFFAVVLTLIVLTFFLKLEEKYIERKPPQLD